jgi:hypothetical protein
MDGNSSTPTPSERNALAVSPPNYTIPEAESQSGASGDDSLDWGLWLPGVHATRTALSDQSQTRTTRIMSLAALLLPLLSLQSAPRSMRWALCSASRPQEATNSPQIVSPPRCLGVLKLSPGPSPRFKRLLASRVCGGTHLVAQVAHSRRSSSPTTKSTMPPQAGANGLQRIRAHNGASRI